MYDIIWLKTDHHRKFENPKSSHGFKLSRQLPLVCLWVFIVIFVSQGCIIGAVDQQREIVDDVRSTRGENNVARDASTSQGSGGVYSSLVEFSHLKTESKNFECHVDDKECHKDKLGFEAIQSLHHLIDDDNNGNVDLSESDEFLRDELQYTDGFERQELFHNNDKLISVDDLWKSWKHSPVHNWTVDDMIEWLVQDVDLPQYSQVFYNLAIDGSALPRLVNSTSPLLSTLGIRNPVHKQKISLKAMDTILFGAPKRLHSYAKDVMLFMAVLLAIGISWFACLHHRYSQTQVKKMMKDLEALQNAEDALKKLSKELADAEKPQSSRLPESQEELRMLRQNSLRLQVPRLGSGDKSPSRQMGSGDKSPSRQIRDNSPHYKREGEIKLKQAEEELANLRQALSDAENRLEIQQQLESQWSIPSELQAWLQLTYELEQVHFNAKRQAAERQLLAARDGCEKVRKRKQALFGALRMAHSNSLDDIDQSILDARAALEEVKQDLQERLHRWHTIEVLCCFPVISNPGLVTLKQLLGRDSANSSRLQTTLLSPITFEESEEDIPTADDNRESENLYNQIPEWPRQQIFAWAHRSRLNNWIKKKTVTNGHTAPAVSTTSKTFHKQQTAGSNTTSGLLKVTSASNAMGGNANSESVDNDSHASSSTNMAGTTTVVPVKHPAIFQLGESSRHERSQSSASLTHFTSHLSNGVQHGHAQGKTLINPATTGSSSLHISNSSGNLLTNKSVMKTVSSSFKMSTSSTGNHLSVKANQQQSTNTITNSVQSMPAVNGSTEAVIENRALNNTREIINNKDVIPALNVVSDNDLTPDLNVVSDDDCNDEVTESITMAVQSQPTSQVVEKADTGSLGSMPRSQNQAPNTEQRDLQTDARNRGPDMSTPKINEKKKTILPKFLQKNKKKQKS